MESDLDEHQNEGQKSTYQTRSRASGAPAETNPALMSEDARKHLRNLKFRNPGRFMEDFNPDSSGREMRKMHRKIYTYKARQNIYDNEGRLMADGRDLCDCLDEECPGCHFPCLKCGSQKCGGDCRCNRRWFYQELEVEGTSQKYTFRNPPH